MMSRKRKKDVEHAITRETSACMHVDSSENGGTMAIYLRDVGAVQVGPDERLAGGVVEVVGEDRLRIARGADAKGGEAVVVGVAKYMRQVPILKRDREDASDDEGNTGRTHCSTASAPRELV
jgi:hypothetical protein